MRNKCHRKVLKQVETFSGRFFPTKLEVFSHVASISLISLVDITSSSFTSSSLLISYRSCVCGIICNSFHSSVGSSSLRSLMSCGILVMWVGSRFLDTAIHNSTLVCVNSGGLSIVMSFLEEIALKNQCFYVYVTLIFFSTYRL